MLLCLLLLAVAVSEGRATLGSWTTSTQRVAPQTTFEPNAFVTSLRGKKVVSSWNGDALDAGLAFTTGVAASVAVKIASGIAYQISLVATALALGSWTGIITINWHRLQNLAARIVPALPSAQDLTRKFDLDGDGKLSQSDVDALKAEVKNFAKRNQHSAAGGVAGVIVGFALL